MLFNYVYPLKHIFLENVVSESMKIKSSGCNVILVF
jgi:hypothetical protein